MSKTWLLPSRSPGIIQAKKICGDLIHMQNSCKLINQGQCSQLYYYSNFVLCSLNLTLNKESFNGSLVKSACSFYRGSRFHLKHLHSASPWFQGTYCPLLATRSTNMHRSHTPKNALTQTYTQCRLIPS